MNGVMGAENERSIQTIHFSKGNNQTTINGKLKGYQSIDYQLRAGAGQTITIRLTSSHRSNYFNLLPPGSAEAAMAIGELSENAFTGLLPDDGLYTVRVYLVRSAARRNESSQFELQVSIEGKPLAALPARVDALVKGTRFHAVATVPCQPAYAPSQACQAGVIRRGQDGTATVELSWRTPEQSAGKRRVLFVKGKPVAADAQQNLHHQRDERGWLIEFDDSERYNIPDALILGG